MGRSVQKSDSSAGVQPARSPVPAGVTVGRPVRSIRVRPNIADSLDSDSTASKNVKKSPGAQKLGVLLWIGIATLSFIFIGIIILILFTTTSGGGDPSGTFSRVQFYEP